MNRQTEMSELGLGRKRRIDIWSNFTYDNKDNKSVCKPCGVKIAGKNTTNLKRHLQTAHPEIHTKIQKMSDDHGPGGNKASDATSPTQQQAISDFLRSSKYKTESKEQQTKEQAIARWIGRTGLPLTTIEDEDFVLMMGMVDGRLTVPKKTKISNLIETQYEHERQKFRESLATARKVSIGLDLWTKKGLTASFLAISACYFCVEKSKPEHILLALQQVGHPHTAQAIKACVDKCMQEWTIPKEKILTVITDNGSNMVAAFKNTTAEETSSEDDSPGSTIESDSEIDDQRYRHVDMELDRTPCVVHTIQLVVHMLQKETTVKRVLDKARSVVKLFRKSSVATQKLLDQCGVIVVNDCPTRWSSSFNMITRLLKVKDAVCQISNDMGWDSLLTSEWQKLSSLHDLLLPFAEHTKTLQSDTTSMSLVVPALFDLLTHLTDFAVNTRYRDLATLADKMRSNLNQRFACILDTTDEKFSPLAAAACFVNPTVCEIIVNVDVANGNIQELLKQAEDYVVKCTKQEGQSENDEEEVIEEPEAAPSSKQPVFRFLSKCRTTRPKQKTFTSSIRQQIIKYKEELSHPITEDTGTDFWLGKCDSVYHSLKPFALDLLAMPASQAFAERVFSITGDLTRGRRNRGRVTLERSAFLKMNRNK
ncbi:zinc finger BED domain-containing protein 4-like [Danio aesculapii]|uniref:zinc finger BED domain-containing protein 4-like n=1 Tax=Danio aesculapii TaxID=1142201 RepID=UPI0024C09CE0|nr:zinc finger BED domain-containing protein 4-like [Danio aesculapii]